MFWKDIRGFVALYVLNFTVLVILFYFLDGFTTLAGIIYFMVLCLFFLAIFLIYYHSRRKRLYSRLKENGVGNVSFEQGVDTAMDLTVASESEKTYAYERKYKEHLLFINRWVHYIKTPLSVIRSITQEEEDFPAMKQIQSESDRMLDGVNMAMNYARAAEFTYDFKIEQVDLNALFVSLINELKHYFIRNNVYPDLRIPAGTFINSDGKWLKFIFYQLMTNAIKYSNPSGHVMIYTDTEGENLSICVKDTGIGISKEDLPRLFEIFFTGSNGRKFGESTGMGLYLVKTICDKLNYSVKVESAPGEGSVFRVNTGGKITKL